MKDFLTQRLRPPCSMRPASPNPLRKEHMPSRLQGSNRGNPLIPTNRDPLRHTITRVPHSKAPTSFPSRMIVSTA